MTTAAFTTPQTDPPPGRSGATALGAVPHPAHRLGNALRALKVFAEAAFGVVVLGEYGQDTGVRRR
ncbi:hypothetical protein C6N75_28250 [Streptomyces solincola]|uniref:Uncharacterized protein n=1 Tax=Streptomyces solincola TaxID=2100817 RepID=A0A2S9PNH8_9ACTN|nr:MULTISPECIES: hypothetical protein [Streptomyces]PRH75953.1 hypothetical protein C6N75_28250 [Streptomyces solincola]